MILTFYYMFATLVQWWRLGALREKLRGTLNGKNALLVCNAENVTNHRRCLENLLVARQDKVACTVVPRQILKLGEWIRFPSEAALFPIDIGFATPCHIEEQNSVYLMLQSELDSYKPHQSSMVRIEKYGQPLAWRTTETFDVILKTDFNYLARLMNSFVAGSIDINHDLQVMSIETIDVEGVPVDISYDKTYSPDERLRYSYFPKQWSEFASNLRSIYQKLGELGNPVITIENGTSSGIAPNKSAAIENSKHTLDVHPPRTKRSVAKAVDKTKGDGDANKSPLPTSTATTTHRKPKSAKINSSSTLPPVEKVKEVKKVKSDTATNASKSKVSEATKSENSTPVKKLYSEAASTSNNKNLQRQNAQKDVSPSRSVKPPNILIYADSTVAKDNVKSVLKHVINKDKYTIYDLPLNTASNFWDSSTSLVVVSGNVTPALTTHLLQYLLTGGQLLCLCSDLLYTVLQTFSTAEVREHELVRFTYGEWKRVKMMHHIFCYQASPAKKQFSQDSSQSSASNGSSPIAPRTPSTVNIQHGGKNHTVHVQVLGAEEVWQSPSLLLATVKNENGGRAIFSQVHLEVDPSQYQDDHSKYTALKDSNEARLQILKHILTTHLDIDCNQNSSPLSYSPAYFLGCHDLKMALLKNSNVIQENKLTLQDGFEIEFCGKDVAPGIASESRLPVLILACPANFSTVNYFDTLNTEYIGRLVIYSDVLTTSQKILEKSLANGLVVIPRQQTKGRGRSNNEWISPIGAAMFSLQLHIKLDSTLGRSLPLVQHLVMVSIVSAIKSIPGLENLDIGLKWPNDLYTLSSVKLGGLVVQSTIEQNVAVVNIGCGINLNNPQPTISLNEVILRHNEEYKTNVAPLEPEYFFAKIFNEIERVLNVVQNDNLDYLMELYYRYWLHTNAKISVSTSEGDLRDVTITGIDDFGFLKVKSDDGVESSVQPDGNTFDMLKGLIAPKIV